MYILKSICAATLYILIMFAMVFLLADAFDKQQPVTKTQHLQNIGVMP